MQRALRIAVVGYGTAGQALAVLLGADGHRLEVFERAAAPGPVGAGFLLQPSGLQVLWNMGLLPQALAHGAPVRRLYGDTPCGRAVMDMQYRDLDTRLMGVGMQRGALFTVLREAWPQHAQLHVDTQITAIDHAGVRVQDQRGQWHGPFDLIIAPMARPPRCVRRHRERSWIGCIHGGRCGACCRAKTGPLWTNYVSAISAHAR